MTVAFHTPMTMKRFAAIIALCLGCLIQFAWAAPQSELLQAVLEIAEPDQVEAYQQMNLTTEQEEKLAGLARHYLPKVRERRAEPALMLPLVSEVLGKVDAVLTPRQRPLARRLIPRPSQWKELKRLYQEFGS